MIPTINKLVTRRNLPLKRFTQVTQPKRTPLVNVRYNTDAQTNSNVDSKAPPTKFSWAVFQRTASMKDPAEQRKFFEDIAKELKLNSMDEWYKVKVAELLKRGAGGILSQYNNSLADTLRSLFPEHQWQPWKLERPTFGFWNDVENQRQFMEWLGKELNVQTLDDWYRVNTADMVKKGGRGLLMHHGNSLSQILTTVYPQHSWEPWRFTSVPKGFWDSPEHQREYLKWIAQELNVKQPEDWYHVTTSELHGKGADGLLGRYSGSLITMLRKMYPEVKWQVHRFKDVPRHFWNTEDVTVDMYMTYLQDRLNLVTPEDWYRVSINDIQNYGGFDLLLRNGGLLKLLQELYPNVNWIPANFTGQESVRSGESSLRSHVTQIFGTQDENHSVAGYPVTSWVPSEKIAFVYYGPHHYQDTYLYGPHQQQQEHDDKLRQACKDSNVTLVEVPYWWDGQEGSLRATLNKVKPNSVSVTGSATPIPATLPSLKISIPQKLVDATRSFLMLPGDWDKRADPTGWWMMKKSDGMRVYWDGRALYSRVGKEIPAPKHFTEVLPQNITLDGIIIGSSSHDEIVRVATTRSEEKWDHVRFVIYDAPSIKEPFEQRYAVLKSISFPDQVHLVDIQQCTGQSHLEQFIKSAFEERYEAIFLRKPGSMYESGYSSSLAELRLEHQENVRMIEAQRGSYGLLCLQPNGQQCIVKCSGQTFQHPPPEGTVLTVTHSGYYNSGKLKYPYYLKSRNDLSWDNVMSEYKKNTMNQ